MFKIRHEFDKTMVECSSELLKHSENYPTYADEGRIFSALCTGFDKSKGLTTDVGITIPMPHISMKFHERHGRDVEAIMCVGRYIQFKFIKTNGGIIPSRYAVQKDIYEYTLTNCLGVKITGAVHNVSAMGLFIDIGAGVTALIPLKYLSTSHTVDTSTRAKEGEEFSAFLHSVENGRIVLNAVPMYGTFEENMLRFKKGTVYPGRITSKHPYGTFIELANNFVGLSSPVGDDLNVGDTVNTVITDINPTSTKVKLKVLSKCDEAPDNEPYGFASLLCGVKSWNYSPTVRFSYKGGIAL